MGVAALPSPKRFAHTLALRWFANMGSLFEVGKSRPNMGRSSLLTARDMPAFSINAPTPDQRQIAPAIETARVTPLCAPCVTAPASALALPENAAPIREKRSIPVHIQLITMSLTSIGKLMVKK
jgi:hypothetical protein